MTTRTTHEIVCDGPGCGLAVPRPTDYSVPEGWRRLYSTDHIPKTLPTRRRSRKTLTRLERMTGSFALDLCPDHPDAFAGHEPRTDGHPGDRDGDGTVSVSCSCGASLGWSRAISGGGRGEEPAGPGERLWWRHLPDDLHAYFPTPTPKES
jgi:hypothetical protein